MEQTRTHWRTQMRIHRVVESPEGIRLEVTISGWNPHRVVHLPIEVFPEGFLEAVEHSPGPHECSQYAYVSAQLRAERASELDPRGPYELHRVEFEDDPESPLGTKVHTVGKDQWDEDGKYVLD